MKNSTDLLKNERVAMAEQNVTHHLVAENSAYEEQWYSGEELNEVHIWGKAVAFQSEVR